MEKSESIKNLSAALAKVQEEMSGVKFDAVNPFLKNKYASLGAIIEASKSALSKNGFSISQLVTASGNEVGITTILMHVSGEYLSSTATLPMEAEKGKSGAQVAGSVITYLRRYALASILNLYTEEDTDGNKPAVQEKPQVKAMTLADAERMIGGDGKTYRDCSDDELRGKQIGITKELNKSGLSAVTRADYQDKLTAVNLILKARNGG